MGMPQAPAPKPEWTPEALKLLMDDFDMDSMDIAIGADPKSVTDMQRMMRAQYLGTFLENPIMAAGMDAQEIKRRMLEAAQMDDIDKLFAKGPDPAAVVAEAQAKADVKETEASATLKMQQAEKTRQEANDTAFNRGLTAGTMVGGVGGMEDAAPDEAAGGLPAPDEDAGGAGMAPGAGAPGPVGG